MSSPTRNKSKISLFELVLFSMFGALMFVSKIIMQAIPNVHLLGMFIMVLTLVFRYKAIIPIYIYIFLDGLFTGFAPWWIPYLYIWDILFLMTLALPKNMSKKISMIVYPIICALYGLLFGTLYAPSQAILFNLDFKGTIAWIITGLRYDIIHAVSNFAFGLLVYPISNILSLFLKNRT